MTPSTHRHPIITRWVASLVAAIVYFVLVLLMERQVTPHLGEILVIGIVVYFTVAYAQRQTHVDEKSDSGRGPED
jgi:hypothetical protein